MINADETIQNLEKWFNENYRFWMRNTCGDSCMGDERESFKRAFEWDLIEVFKAQDCLHQYGVKNGDELDKETCIRFFKIKCMDLYGREWKSHWDGYHVE